MKSYEIWLLTVVRGRKVGDLGPIASCVPAVNILTRIVDDKITHQ